MNNTINKIDLINQIPNGTGVKTILDAASEVMGNPILLHDMDYKVIAFTDADTDDPIFRESLATGMISGEQLLFLRDECYSERVADARSIIFLLCDKLPYDRMFRKLFTTNNIQVGYACMVACNKPFEPADPELFELVCGKLDKEFYASEFYQHYGQAFLDSLVNQLLEGKVEDTDLISHIESIYMGLKGILRLAVVDTGQGNPEYSKLEYLRDCFKKARPEFKYVIYQNYIVGLFSSDHTALEIEPVVTLHNLFEQNNLYAGISDCFEKIFDLPIYYHQAVNALNQGLRNSDNNQRIFLHGKNSII